MICRFTFFLKDQIATLQLRIQYSFALICLSVIYTVKLEKQVGVRLTQEVHTLLCHITESRGEDLSDFVRRAIYKELAELSFLPKNHKKALGISVRETKQTDDSH